MEWELVKENFQPLKAGRDPTQLVKKALEAPSKDNAAAEETRRQFWREIAEYKGDDPLAVWLRFIKWTQDTFKSGGHQAELIPLLERCTRELQDLPRYKDDPRYLRVWVQYADCLPEPRDVFSYLKENNIGQDFALYYLAHAAYLELRGSYKRAEAVFQAGLDRMAYPVDRLRSKYQDFQHRMERRMQRKAEEGGDACADAEDTDVRPRAALNTLRSVRTHAPSRPPSARGGADAGAGAGGISRPKRKNLSLTASGTAEGTNTGGDGLEIYVDDEFRAGAPASSQPSGVAAADGLGGWTRLATAEQTRKENVQQASTWAGAKLKQKKALVVPPAPPLDIPVDPELAGAPSPAKPKAGTGREGTLRQRLEAADLDEHLQHDPLRLHKHPELAPRQRAQHAQGPAASGVAAAAASHHGPHMPPAAKRKRQEQLSWNAELLKDAEGNELCFEEVRSRHHLQQLTVPGSPADVGSDMEMELSSPSPAQASVPTVTLAEQPSHVRSPAHAAPAATPAMHHVAASATSSPPLQQQVGTGREALRAVQDSLAAAVERSDQVRLGRQGSSTSPDSAVSAQSAGRAPSRAAAQHVPATGGVPSLAADMQRGKQPEPDVTMATREAFAAVNNMFGGGSFSAASRQLPAAQGARQQGSMPSAGDEDAASLDRAPSHPRQPEPQLQRRRIAQQPSGDVTIATRNAFDAVNAMFHGALPRDASWLEEGDVTSLNRRAARRRDSRVTTGTGALTGQLPHGVTLAARARPQRMAFCRNGAAVAEPTVTICTRAAFEALNDMFGGRLPHEATGGIAPREGATEGRAPPASWGGSAGIPDAAANHAAGLQAAQSRGAATPGGATQGEADRAASEEDQDQGFPVYEDTGLLGGAALSKHPTENLMADRTMAIYEDTQFLTGPAAPNLAEAASPCSAPAAQGQDLPIYEDTHFMSENVLPQRPPSAAAGDLQIYEDTQFVTGHQRSRPPLDTAAAGHGSRFVPPGPGEQHDRTALMSENVAPPMHMLSSHAPPTSQPLEAEDWDVPDAEQENVVGAGVERALPARRLSEPGVAACALQDLCEERAAALGAHADPLAGYNAEDPNDMPPLERLRLARDAKDDGFEVHRSPHASAPSKQIQG